jgi:hypothetical protein
MEISLKYVSERDLDLLVLEEIISSKSFLNIFLKRLNIPNAEVLSVIHSLTHMTLGESDLTIILKVNDKKHAILLENKIDAIAMENQSGRYTKRGNIGIKENQYDSFDVFLIAPQQYYNSNDEAKKYPYFIAYEEFKDYFKRNNDPRSNYKLQVIKNAIEKEDNGYQPVEHLMITKFWSGYYKFKNENYPHLYLKEVKGPRGSIANWPGYKTDLKNSRIIHKSDRGYVDFTFFGTYHDFGYLKELFKDILDDSITINRSSKSSFLRINVPEINFKEDINDYIEQLFTVFIAIDKFHKLASKLDHNQVFRSL